MDREEQIDDLLSHVGKSGLGIFRKLYTLLVNHASTGIVQAAMKLTGGQDQVINYNTIIIILYIHYRHPLIMDPKSQ